MLYFLIALWSSVTPLTYGSLTTLCSCLFVSFFLFPLRCAVFDLCCTVSYRPQMSGGGIGRCVWLFCVLLFWYLYCLCDVCSGPEKLLIDPFPLCMWIWYCQWCLLQVWSIARWSESFCVCPDSTFSKMSSTYRFHSDGLYTSGAVASAYIPRIGHTYFSIHLQRDVITCWLKLIWKISPWKWWQQQLRAQVHIAAQRLSVRLKTRK